MSWTKRFDTPLIFLPLAITVISHLLSDLQCAIGIKMLCYGSLSVHVTQKLMNRIAPRPQKLARLRHAAGP
jgi:hypothetical protein